MVVKIRLARFGKTNAPFYNIVVAQARYDICISSSSFLLPIPLFFAPPRALSKSPLTRNAQHVLLKIANLKPPLYAQRSARNSKPLEVLGTYDPIPKVPPYGDGRPFKDIKLDISRAKYWLGVGAQPSEPAWRLLSMVSYYAMHWGALLYFADFVIKMGRRERLGRGGEVNSEGSTVNGKQILSNACSPKQTRGSSIA